MNLSGVLSKKILKYSPKDSRSIGIKRRKSNLMQMRKPVNVPVVVNNQCMKKSRLIFYWTVLILLMFLYYGISDSLYSISQIDLNGGAMVGVELIAVIIAPLTIVLGILRLWLLKPMNQRHRLLDISYFVIPVLIMIACFAAQFWVAIILSALTEILIVYEFIRSVIKKISFEQKG